MHTPRNNLIMHSGLRSVLQCLHVCVGLGLMGLGFAACSDSTGPTSPPVMSSFWALRLNQHAVTLAAIPGIDTVQLRAAALTSAGDTLTTTQHVIYTSRDSSVTVDSTGLVTAKYPTSQPIVVTANLTIGNLTLQDQVLIAVTATPPAAPFDTFSIQPQAGDSAKLGARFVGGGIALSAVRKQLAIKVVDNTGTAITIPLVYFRSSDPTVATIDSLRGQVIGQRPGQVMLYAETDLYGVTRRDSLPFVIGNPVFATITALASTPVGSLTPVLYFQPHVLTVGVGAVITWRNSSTTDSMDVVFDDPAQALASCRFPGTTFCALFPPSGSGNIAPWVRDPTAPLSDRNTRNGDRARLFSVAGTYPFHSTRYPSATGVIYVQAP